MRLSTLSIWTFLLCIAQSIPAHSAQSTVSTEQTASSPDEIVVILNPSVTSKGLAFLATKTIPVEYRTRARESLAAIAKQRYGVAERFRDSLRELNATLAAQLARKGQDLMWAELPEDTTVHLPPVSSIAQDVPVTVHSVTSLKQLARQYYPEVGPKTLASIEAANKGNVESPNLKPGAKVTLPWVPSVQVLRVRPGTGDGVLVSLQAQRIGKGFENKFGLLEQPITAHSTLRDIQADEKWFVAGVSAQGILPQDLRLRSDVIVGVLDSGIDPYHPAFAHDLWIDPDEQEGYVERLVNETHGIDSVLLSNDVTDIEPHSHGTHVAGIASGRLLKEWSNAFANSDLDDRMKLMIIKVVREQIEQDSQTGKYKKEYKVDVGAVLVGIDFAAEKNARIVSGSWDFANLPQLKSAIEAKTGMLFIFAAGNGQIETVNGEQVQVGFDIDKTPVYPPSFKSSNVITVGALDPNGDPAYFSNFGSSTVQLFAPGYKIKSTVTSSSPTGLYDTESGTSQATPFVALAAGLIWAKDGTLTTATVRRRILDTADPDLKLLKESQYGKLNLLKAISIDTDLLQLTNDNIVRGTVVSNTIRIAADGLSCASTTPVDVTQAKVVRLFTKFEEDSSLLVTRGERKRVKVCDLSYQIRTPEGTLINKQLAEISDVVWRLRK
jgi:subtilisin family serine protease